MKKRIASVEVDKVGLLVAAVFADMLKGPEHRDRLARYVSAAAEHFLDTESYNAAKHGFALQGARSRLTVNIEGLDLIDEQGLTIEWLSVRGARPRWTRTTRWFSIEATTALSFVAIRLIEALWLIGRHRHLGEPLELTYDPPDPGTILGAIGVTHLVLLEIDEPLAYNGVAPQLVIRKPVRNRWAGGGR